MNILLRGLIAFWLGFALAATFNAIAHAQYPPARFDHPNSHTIVQWKSFAEVRAICHGGAACSFATLRPCLIIAYHGDPRGDEWILRHETAHCNGWPGNHPS